MDTRTWRKILLQWITGCNFQEQNCFNVEQTDIDEFYKKFCNHHELANETPTIRSFLEKNYPDFQLNVDDDNALSAAEYIYIYSLLLYFSCVKCPESYFRGICQKLSEQTQQCIATFFKHLMDFSKITKERLRHAIAEAAATYTSPQSAHSLKNESVTSSNSSNGVNSIELQTSFCTSSSRQTVESPSRTPNRKMTSTVQRVSPGTPKTFLLEERTRELFNYKAQLETERYEKGLLELQITQNEEQIASLNQVQKKLQQKIRELKDEILNKSAETDCQNREDDEGLRMRLCRQINDKERENYNLSDSLRTLREENSLLENKLRHAEKNVAAYRENICELEVKVEELLSEVQKKGNIIKCLSDDKAELEHFIAETRSASGSSRPDFNVSIDCLDTSARNTNSSDSLGSPENLGVSVVDVQLREKEHENAQLREELQLLHLNNTQLSQFIQEKVHSYAKEFNTIVNVVGESTDPALCVDDCISFVENITMCFRDAKNHIKKLEKDLYEMKNKNHDLQTCVEDLTKELGLFKDNLQLVETKNMKYIQDIKNLEELKQQLVVNYEASVDNFIKQIKSADLQKTTLEYTISELSEKIDLQSNRIISLEEMNNAFQSDKDELERLLDELQKKNVFLTEQFESRNKAMQDKMEHQDNKLQSHMDAERLIKEKYEKALIQNEELLRRIRDSDSHLETMRTNINAKETELSKLGKEIVQLGKTNSQLEERINKLTYDFQQEQNKHAALLMKRDSEMCDLKLKLVESERQNEKTCIELKSNVTELKEAGEKVDALCLLLNMSTTDGGAVAGLTAIATTVIEMLNRKKEDIAEITTLKEEQKQSVEHLQEIITSKDELVRLHKRECEDLNEDFQKAKQEIEKLEKYSQDLQENHKKMISKLEKDLVIEQRRVEEMVRIVENMRAEKKSLEKTQAEGFSRWQKRDEELKAKFLRLEQQHNQESGNWQNKEEQLKAELTGEKEMRGFLEKELAAQIEEHNRTKHSLNKYETELEQLRLSYEQSESEQTQIIAALNGQIDILAEAKSKLFSELNSEKEVRVGKTTELEHSQQEVIKLQTEMEVKQQDFDATKIDLDIKIQDLESKLNSEKAARVVIERELALLNDKYENLRLQLESTEQQLLQLQKTYASAKTDFQTNIEKYESSIQLLNIQNEKFVNEIKNFKAEHTKVETQMIKADDVVKGLSEQLEKTNAMIAERNVKLEESQYMLNLASEKLESQTETTKVLQATCEKQSAELQNLREQLAQLEEKKQQQNDELVLLRDNITEQTNKLKINDDEIENLKEVQKRKIELATLLEKTCDRQKIELANIAAEAQQMQEQLKEIEALKLVDKARSDEIQRLEIELETLKCAYERATTELAEQLELISKEKEKAVKLEKDLSDAINIKTAEVDELRGLLNETEVCLKSVNNECTKLQSEILAKEAELRMLNDELNHERERCHHQIKEASIIANCTDQAIIEMLEFANNSLSYCNVDTLPQTPTAEMHECYSKLKNSSRLLNLRETLSKILVVLKNQQTELTEITALKERLAKLDEHHTIMLENGELVKHELAVAMGEIDALKAEKISIEKMLSNENKRVASDLQNLELVNDKLSNEIATLQLQLSNKESDLSTAQITIAMQKATNECITQAQESLESNHFKEMEKLLCEHQIMKNILNENETKIQNLQKRYIEEQQREASANQKLCEVQTKLEELKAEYAAQTTEFDGKCEESEALNVKCNELEQRNVELDTQLSNAKKESIALRGEVETFTKKYQRCNEELAVLNKELEECNAALQTSNEKLVELTAEKQQLERDLNATQTQISDGNAETEILMREHKICLEEKHKLAEELSASRHECHELRNNKTELEQKIALSTLEKDDLVRQMELLRTQRLQESETSAQTLERNLLTSENALKTLRVSHEQYKSNAEKLEFDNKKLRENVENQMKRIEKLSLKLGESQASCAKLERDNEKLSKCNKIQIANFEVLQREKDNLLLESKRISKVELLNEQLQARIQSVEAANELLSSAKTQFEATEIDLKSRISKLEHSRQISEDRLRKMTNDFERSERENVNLNHQIGALNSEILTLKNGANDERNTKFIEMNRTLNETQSNVEKCEQLCKKLENEKIELEQQNESNIELLSKTKLSLQITKANNDQFSSEIKQLQAELKRVEQEKAELKQVEINVTAQLKQYESITQKLTTEKRDLEQRLISSEILLTTKESEAARLLKELDELQQHTVENSTILTEKNAAITAELENLRARLVAGEVLLEKEQAICSKLRVDNQILQAKYRELKQRAETESTTSEERIKENRLELEGKLEKMKNKMKALYTEEVTKMKSKQERETTTLRSELSILKTQNSKYEEHTRKLSNELMSLNERMLDYQKENAYLLTKLKHLQNEEQPFKRPQSSTTVSRLPSSQPIPPNMGGNLAMEDEEGEIFNNTYLTDLKNGRMSEIGAEELQLRNSLLPPHLKSSYAVQYDHGLCEDEVKDGPVNSLDDSMSALLSSSTSCNRKKISGTTHYRKPGPPTPSKNGGRLSFGGTSEPAREILREYDDNSHTSKTPARFGFFSSRFSLGNTTKDEQEESARIEQPQSQQQQQYQQQPKTLNPVRTTKVNDVGIDLRRAIQEKNFEINKFGSVERVRSTTKICTSTPRKTRVKSIDKRRLLHELMSSPSKSSIASETRDITLPELSAIETPPTMASHSRRLSNVLRLRRSKIGTTNVTPSSSSGTKITTLQRRLRRHRSREQSGRPSLCIHKNIYSNKYSSPQRSVLRDLKRVLVRKQRMTRFDQQRKLFNTTAEEALEETDSHLNVEETGDEEDSHFNAEESSKEESNSSSDYVNENRRTSIIVINDATYNADADSDNQFKTIIVIKNEIDGSYEDLAGLESTSDINESTNNEDDNDVNGNENEYMNVTTNSDGDGDDDIEKVDSEGREHKSQLHRADATKIVSETELIAFDQQLEQLQSEICAESSDSCARFEQLLKETVSEAPFEIRNMPFSATANSQSNSGPTTISTTSIASRSHLSGNMNPSTFASCTAIVPLIPNSLSSLSSSSETALTTVTATPHRSSVSSISSSLLHHSRTIYGASVVFNRRIPNIDATHVRKSSIYFKNPKCSTFRASSELAAVDCNDTSTIARMQSGDLVLVTNQTISLYDLFCMWRQMNVWTRLVIGIILLGFICVVSTLIYVLCFGYR